MRKCVHSLFVCLPKKAEQNNNVNNNVYNHFVDINNNILQYTFFYVSFSLLIIFF